MTEEKVKTMHTCNACGEKDHKWHEVYYEESSTLKKAEKSYITWCEKVKGYVIVNGLI